MTIRYETTLWKKLSEKGLVAGEEPVLVEDSAPWYVRTMLGIAGWIGALFMLGALFSGFWAFFESEIASGVLGLVACLVSIVIYRSMMHNDFMAQFGFAISLAGQGLLTFGMLQGLELFEGGDEFIGRVRMLALIMVVLQLILFIMIPNFLHRIWSGVIGISALTFLLIQFGFYPFSLAILLALGGAWGNNLSSLLLGGVLIAVVAVLLVRAQVNMLSSKGVAALFLALFIALMGVWTPGITIALVFVILGYAHGNKVLTGVGLVTLVIFVSQFYYQLDLTLLYKSLVLVVSGLALLLIRAADYRW